MPSESDWTADRFGGTTTRRHLLGWGAAGALAVGGCLDRAGSPSDTAETPTGTPLTDGGTSPTTTDEGEVIDLRELPGSEQGHVVRGEGKFPRFARYDDGTVFVATHRGSHKPAPDNSLQGFISTDGGRNWSDPREMFREQGIDPRSPAMGVRPDGVLYGAWRERQWDEPSNSRVAFYRSEDRGREWTFVTEIEIPDDNAVGHPYGRLLFDDGHIYAPIYTISDSRALMDTRLFVGEEGGSSWEQRAIIQSGTGEAGGNETFLTRRPNSDLLAFYRDHRLDERSLRAKVWVATSDDDGHTWSDPTRLTDRGEHPAATVFLDDDVLLCLYSHRNPPFGVRGHVSLDGGRTWRDDLELIVDDSRTHWDCGYPTATVVDGGETLLIAWYVNDDGADDLDQRRQCRTLRVDRADVVGSVRK
jgi:hypothetical protein